MDMHSKLRRRILIRIKEYARQWNISYSADDSTNGIKKSVSLETVLPTVARVTLLVTVDIITGL